MSSTGNASSRNSNKNDPSAATTTTATTTTNTSVDVNTTNEYDESIQSIFDLMYQRVNGSTVSNEQIESAVQNIIMTHSQQQQQQQQTNKNNTQRTVISVSSNEQQLTQRQQPQVTQKIIRDMGNYDDDDDDDDNDNGGTMDTLSTKRKPTIKYINDKEATSRLDSSQKNIQPSTSNDTKRQKREDEEDDDDEIEKEFDTSIYECIPLGKQGAQMMTIFGDGKYPQVAAVRAALYGTRQKLQCTIQDARYIRKQQSILYRTAKNSIKTEKPSKPGIYKQEWSTELLFRASTGYDPLAYIPKCGFGIEELYKLYPEELNAYNKWNEMHIAAAELTTNTPTGGEAQEDDKMNDDDGTNQLKQIEEEDATMISGHLQERAAQFDIRTDKMGHKWYMKYSKIRQRGTFLPGHNSRTANGNNRGGMNIDTEWETTTRQKRKLGEHTNGGWTHMSASAVRFLHWIGFDPMSPVLPPPNDDVTAALAFLAYDFFGRIVEKAIFLRNRQMQHDMGLEIIEVAISNYELADGEQLTEHDIDRAMNDPDIKPISLYSANDVNNKNRSIKPQLYFGPGFEDRLEMEMEEMLWDSTKTNTKLSEEELLLRKQEDELFARLAEPPSEDGLITLLRAKEGTNINIKASTESELSSTNAGSKRSKPVDQ